jgi:hypothetical protein
MPFSTLLTGNGETELKILLVKLRVLGIDPSKEAKTKIQALLKPPLVIQNPTRAWRKRQRARKRKGWSEVRRLLQRQIAVRSAQDEQKRLELSDRRVPLMGINEYRQLK